MAFGEAAALVRIVNKRALVHGLAGWQCVQAVRHASLRRKFVPRFREAGRQPEVSERTGNVLIGSSAIVLLGHGGEPSYQSGACFEPRGKRCVISEVAGTPSVSSDETEQK